MKHAVIRPLGVLESESATQIRNDVEVLISQGESAVLIDFQDITFMNSSAIGILVATLKLMQSAGKRLSLCSLTPEVKIIFELTSMDKIFEIFRSQEDFEEKAYCTA